MRLGKDASRCFSLCARAEPGPRLHSRLSEEKSAVPDCGGSQTRARERNHANGGVTWLRSHLGNLPVTFPKSPFVRPRRLCQFGNVAPKPVPRCGRACVMRCRKRTRTQPRPDDNLVRSVAPAYDRCRSVRRDEPCRARNSRRACSRRVPTRIDPVGLGIHRSPSRRFRLRLAASTARPLGFLLSRAFLGSVMLPFAALAAIAWLWLQPAFERCVELRAGWILARYALRRPGSTVARVRAPTPGRGRACPGTSPRGSRAPWRGAARR